ncbi:Fms-interacting protein [Nitzschia inconspicua]|uniref:Fms-interacting protein n=1 Tax=Nitzschia inconspicua TaxID=303405 RepID=A0A9K3PUT6_9STRA|nr:Fms-interacting protein [Nitzschia inconspicua]
MASHSPPQKRQRLDEANDGVGTRQPDDDTNTTTAITSSSTFTATATTATVALMETSPSEADQAHQTQQYISTLNDKLDVLENEGSSSSVLMDASMAMLGLKRLQRQILERAQTMEKILQRQAKQGRHQQVKLDNLKYQHVLNQASMRPSTLMNSTVETSQLYQLAAATTSATSSAPITSSGNGNHNDTAMDTTTTTTTTTTDNNDDISGTKVSTDEAENVIRRYLDVSDWKNPKQRTVIVEKLNQELQKRQTLEKQLQHFNDELQTKHELLRAKQRLLQGLPAKLAEMEKASLPLQKFFHSTLPVTPKLVGSRREERLDLAKQLPKALYTLYHQLQSCLDVLGLQQQEKDTGTVKNNQLVSAESLPALEIFSDTTNTNNGDMAVSLKVPVPTISDGGTVSYHPKKYMTVTFRYSPDMVTASGSNDFDMGSVIEELFPGDVGEWSPPINGAAAASAAAILNYSNHIGKPYQWCNYLAGLHIAPSEQMPAKMHTSTKVIVLALIKRVRATATLSWILAALSRRTHPLPQHHAMIAKQHEHIAALSSSSSKVKLTSWILLSNTETASNEDVHDDNTNYDEKHCRTVRSYKVTLKRGSATLNARVTIHMARYPSLPPHWKIRSQPEGEVKEDESSTTATTTRSLETLPLYDETLARLEHHLNRNVEEMVVTSDETTYEWILAQQLVELADQWDQTFDDNN